MDYSTKILRHFEENDPVLHAAAKMHGISELGGIEAERFYERLCRAIVGQQLSVKAAATIWGRFEELLGEAGLHPEVVLELAHDEMRGVGLSNAKARYVHGLADAVVNKEIELEKLVEMENEAVVSELIKLKGIGQWTAEMFLMFTLGREDVFSVGDLGLRRAMEKLYGLENPSDGELVRMAEKWSPYRTYACKVLWDSLDNVPE